MKYLSPKISVIIPTYKPQEYLWECLTSLERQTLSLSEFEVILVLNGCNEPYCSQIQEHLKTSQLNVNFIHTLTGGVSNARNIALDVAKGEYITFIDDDDYVSPSYLEELLNCSSGNCVGLANGIFFDDKSKDIREKCSYGLVFKRLSHVKSPSLFQTRVFFNGPVLKLIHRDIIGERRFDTRFANGEDNLMMFLISNRIKSIRFTTSNAVYYRRVRENSATTRHRSLSKVAKNSFKIMGLYIKYVSKDPFGYNYPFVLSRFAAEIKSIIIR